MINNTKIAILLATFNGERFLSQLLDSLFKQTYQDFTIFISDDSSTDKTLSIIHKYMDVYPERIFLISSKKHFGNACENFLFLVSNVESDLYMFCDQDDVWLDNKIQYCYEKYQSISDKKNPIVIHTDLEIVDENLNYLNGSFYKYLHIKKIFTNNEYLIQNNVVGCTMLINKQAINLYKSNNIENANLLMHDYFFALIAFFMGKIEFIDIPLIKYRQHSNNSVGAKKEQLLLFKRIKSIKKGNKNLISCINTNKELLKVLPDNCIKKNMIKTYCSFYDMNKLNRIKFLLKNQIYEKSFLRTLYLYITC